MKNILSHFRISIMLGLAIIATFTTPQTINIMSEITSAAENADVDGDVLAGNSSSIQNPSDSSSDVPIPEIPKDQFSFTSQLIIKAVNPGYTVDGTREVDEFIEIQKTIDSPLSLAGYSVRYTNSSGNSTTLLSFSEGSTMAGEFLLMRLARSPDSEKSDITYMTTLAMSTGTVELLYNDEVIDGVCWTSSKSDICLPSFKNTKPTVLVRNSENGNFEHLSVYLPHFDPAHPSLVLPDNPPTAPSDPNNPPASGSDDPNLDDQDSNDKDQDDTFSPENHPSDDKNSSSDSDPSVEPVSARCYGIEFSEILSYYVDDNSEQFIELYNPTERNIDLNGCSLRYKNKSYNLTGMLNSNGYSAYYPTKMTPSFSFTKNPNSSNMIELVDADGGVVDILVYSHGQKKSTSYAKFYDTAGDELWQLTYAPTPGLENTYQEFRSCPTGKVINPATGNCVKATATATSAVAECPAGKYRNPLTGRCKNIESESTGPKPCAEGYERNPETNRCRKITATNDGAGFALVPTTHSSKSTFVALGAVIMLVLLGVVYIILQFRHEIARAIRKIKQRLHHIR